MKRSKFSLSHYKLLTCDMGELVPIMCQEVLPGDTFQHATSLLLRVSPLLASVMHPVHVRVHHWFVPNRLLWDDWEEFITGGDLTGTPPAVPIINQQEILAGSLGDYLGLPLVTADPGTNALTWSALPFRAYALIWNEWYRDQDLQNPLTIEKTGGADVNTNRTLQRCAWEKDYFTSARPWPQKGDEVTIPLGGTIPVTSDGTQPNFNVTGGGANLGLVQGDDAGVFRLGLAGGAGPAAAVQFGSNTGLEGDLSTATVVGINELREAFALQRYAEARARYGSRYSEYLRYLGVRSSDARLQRPEYLGGGKQTIQFSEVLQTAPVTDFGAESFTGTMRGHGISAMRSNRYRRFFEEHGYVISLLSVKPKTMYGEGISKAWLRRTKEDYFQRELQHIGQQEILGKELRAVGATPYINNVWGYQDRYDEYRRCESGVAGEFRDDLNFWHYARQYGTDPALNSDFITATPTKRVNAVQNKDVLWIMANHSIQARRLVAGSGKSFIY